MIIDGNMSCISGQYDMPRKRSWVFTLPLLPCPNTTLELISCFSTLTFPLFVLISVSLDNVSVDITELDKGMDLTRREFEARSAGEREAPFIIKDFLANSEDKMKKLKTDLKSAKVRICQTISWDVTQSYQFQLSNVSRKPRFRWRGWIEGNWGGWIFIGECKNSCLLSVSPVICQLQVCRDGF